MGTTKATSKLNSKATPAKGVRVVSDSSLMLDFIHNNIRYRKTLKLAPTKANLNFAERKLAQIKLEIAAGTFDIENHFPSKTIDEVVASNTLKPRLELAMKGAQKKLKASTLQTHRGVLRTLIKEIGDWEMDKLTTHDIVLWLQTTSIKPSRLALILPLLRQVFTDAYLSGELERDLVPAFRRAERHQPKTSVEPFTKEEVDRLLAAVKHKSSYHSSILLSLWTGMRPNEILALRVNQVDFVRRLILVTHNMSSIPNEGLTTTKTKAGVREVSILEPILPTLHSLVKGKEPNEGLLYPLGSKTQLPVSLSCIWRKVCEKAEVSHRAYYQLRHTYASRMISAGENLWWVAKQMGHANTLMIQKTYGQWLPDTGYKGGEKMLSKYT